MVSCNIIIRKLKGFAQQTNLSSGWTRIWPWFNGLCDFYRWKVDAAFLIFFFVVVVVVIIISQGLIYDLSPPPLVGFALCWLIGPQLIYLLLLLWLYFPLNTQHNAIYSNGNKFHFQSATLQLQYKYNNSKQIWNLYINVAHYLFVARPIDLLLCDSDDTI